MKFVTATAFSDPSHYVPMARAADEAGFHAMATSDHVVHPQRLDSPYPYSKDGSPRWEPFTPWLDPWVAIGAMAAVTERLRFFTNIFVLPLRNPFLTAKAIGTAAVLSDNRVALGIGVGWMEEEFRLCGADFAGRGRRADEMLDVMRALWSNGWTEHHGRAFDFDPLEMSPTPTAPIPVYVGGISEPALRRAARNDGWIADLHSTDEIAAFVERLHGYRAEIGRSAEPFEVIVAATDAYDLDTYRRLSDVGATQVMTMPWFFYGGPTDDLAPRLDGIRRFGEDVIRAFDA